MTPIIAVLYPQTPPEPKGVTFVHCVMQPLPKELKDEVRRQDVLFSQRKARMIKKERKG